MFEGKNVWQIIFEVLKENGIRVYPPATNNDNKCKSPYVVVKKDGSIRMYGLSTQRDYYLFMLYVPRTQYSILSEFEAGVKEILDKPPLYPMIMPTGITEDDYYDDNLDAHLRMFTYYNNVRNRHL